MRTRTVSTIVLLYALEWQCCRHAAGRAGTARRDLFFYFGEEQPPSNTCQKQNTLCLNEGAIISVVKWMFSPIIHATTNRIGAHRIYTPNRDERGRRGTTAARWTKRFSGFEITRDEFDRKEGRWVREERGWGTRGRGSGVVGFVEDFLREEPQMALFEFVVMRFFS